MSTETCRTYANIALRSHLLDLNIEDLSPQSKVVNKDESTEEGKHSTH